MDAGTHTQSPAAFHNLCHVGELFLVVMTPPCVCVSTHDVQAPYHGAAENIVASY